MTNRLDWHDYRAPMTAAINAGNAIEFQRLLTEALAIPGVVISPDSIIAGNEKGKAYFSMGQTDLGLMCIQAEAKFHVPSYYETGHACIAPVIAKKRQGGLDEDGWLCSTTSIEGDAPGHVLNQHLIAARNLASAGYHDDAVAAVNCLSSGKLTLRKFFVEVAGRPVVKSWLYYGLGKKDGYFLNRPHKTGNYAVKVMEMLYYLYTALPEAQWEPLRSPMKRLWRTYSIKLKEGLYVDSRASPGGDFGALDPGMTPPLDPAIVTFYEHI